MKKICLVMFNVLVVTAINAQVKPTPKAVVKPGIKNTAPSIAFKTLADSASYALGLRIAQSFKSQGLDPINLNILQKGMQDALQSKKPIIAEDALDKCIGAYQTEIQSAKAATVKKAGKLFLEANAKRSGVISLPSGLQYEVLKAGGNGPKPTLNNKVKCHYHGTLTNGEVFDSSVERGEPITFSLAQVIQGWQEALQLMTVGSKWKIYVPAALAYGDRSTGKIPGGSVLVFEVELLGIE
ncbi:MAG: FKBP-type peptidyl-prolyl cis-trans isomerase [Sediminibacterium sp.]|jgi:FKBP-type peptidyl-prolyl cis-trans isomerase FklB